jgi:hypothetical protein
MWLGSRFLPVPVLVALGILVVAGLGAGAYLFSNSSQGPQATQTFKQAPPPAPLRPRTPTLLAGPALKQAPLGGLTGSVVLSNCHRGKACRPRPATGAEVVAQGKTRRFTLTADRLGRFEMLLPPGAYKLTALRAGKTLAVGRGTVTGPGFVTVNLFAK